jgi:peptidoglycan hydrolase-like protein with peptidoglycan-binding domain
LRGRLQTLGYLPSTATIDGVYGSETRDAIASWQKASGLRVTGFLDDADAKLLAISSVTATSGAAATETNSPSELTKTGNTA